MAGPFKQKYNKTTFPFKSPIKKTDPGLISYPIPGSGTGGIDVDYLDSPSREHKGGKLLKAEKKKITQSAETFEPTKLKVIRPTKVEPSSNVPTKPIKVTTTIPEKKKVEIQDTKSKDANIKKQKTKIKKHKKKTKTKYFKNK